MRIAVGNLGFVFCKDTSGFRCRRTHRFHGAATKCYGRYRVHVWWKPNSEGGS